MSSRPLEPFACQLTNKTSLALVLRFTNVDSKTCRFLMVERADGVKSIATKVRNRWFYWWTGEMEWIECVVDPGATMRLHCDASSMLKCTMRVFLPDEQHFVRSRETEYVFHFKHEDDTYVYTYSITMAGARFVTENGCPAYGASDYKQLFFRTQLLRGNSVHDGLEVTHMGQHIVTELSDQWDQFVVPHTHDDDIVADVLPDSLPEEDDDPAPVVVTIDTDQLFHSDDEYDYDDPDDAPVPVVPTVDS